MPAIDELFDTLLAHGGSALHLSPGQPPMMRLREGLTPLGRASLSSGRIMSLLGELLDTHRKRLLAERKEVDFAHPHGDLVRFRVHAMTKASGPGAIFQTIPTTIPSPENLGLPESLVALATRPSGLLLIAGPAASGKSTTIASLLSHLNAHTSSHICTIEAPVEFILAPRRGQITHREVGVDTPSFADAATSALREDADVVYLAELPDATTLEAALDLAAAGSLVLTTVRANSSAGALDRLTDVLRSTELPRLWRRLSDTLAGIVIQQLVDTPDGSGKVAVHEVVPDAPELLELIAARRLDALDSWVSNHHGAETQSMDVDLERLGAEGHITATDALDKAVNKAVFAQRPVVATQLE